MTPEALSSLILARYPLVPTNIRPTERGFFGETFCVETSHARYFAKCDGWKEHQKEFQHSLPWVHTLTQAGLSFVPRVIPTNDHALSVEQNGVIVALFEYVDGIHTEEYPLSWLFEKLVLVYQTVPVAPQTTPFTNAVYDEFCARRAALCMDDPIERQAARLLDTKEALFAKHRQKLEYWTRQINCLSLPTVLTHGDAGGNCILHDQTLSIIDWDSVRPAPPERDAWFFMHRKAQTAEIEEALERAGFPYRLHPEAFAYYAYHSFFYYLCEHLRAIQSSTGKQKEKQLHLLEQYFPSWIWDQLQAADEVPER